MKELAKNVHLLGGFPSGLVNIYLLGDVLIDAGTRRARRRILRELGDRRLAAHALTHAHPDHQGSSHAICEHYGIPLWCGRHDVPPMEHAGGIALANPQVPTWLAHIQERLWAGPPHPVARALGEGDEVVGFTVLETPGHTRGHISLWREADRVLIVGDVLVNARPLTGVPGLHEPPGLATVDRERNRSSARRLAALEPRLACFGHGPPLRDPAGLSAFVAALPDG